MNKTMKLNLIKPKFFDPPPPPKENE
jgi:hypothetical protein